jgi:signal transduction histidine kinase/CheY-like chemotaxis protein
MTGSDPGFASFLSRVHPEDMPRVQELAAQLTTGAEGETFEHEFRLIGNDGVARWARARGRLEKHEGVVRMAGTVMDVTEHHRLEAELRRAHRLESIGRLAGGLAHDFNNLLTAMLGSLELMEEGCPPNLREDLGTVRHGAERARDLTAQLLAFARKQPIVLEVIDLSALVTNVERLLRRLVGPTVELTVSCESGLSVRADAAQLEQVLVNLVVNARDAMPQGGALSVRARGEPRTHGAAQENVVLEVEDHGTGMDAETISHVFDPFFSTKDGGTGLGLASSYGIVLQHGGNIQVDSDPGKGARFRVVLPRVREPVRPAAQPSNESGGAGCVLLVDDEDSVRRTTARLLTSLGYEVLLAESGQRALEIAKTYPGPIDILLCDVAMPERSGPEVAKDIRSVSPGIRVLFVSGYPEGEENVVSSAGFLQKPFSRAALSAKLAALRG